MKVAICFHGLMRNMSQESYLKLKENILDILTKNNIQYDIYVHTFIMPFINNERSGENKITLRNDDYKILKPKKFKLEIQKNVDNKLNHQLYRKLGDWWYDDFNSMKNIVRSFHSQYECYKLINNPNQYNLIFCMRPDIYYADKLDIQYIYQINNLSEDAILVPNFAHFGGYNDRLSIGKPKVMKKIMNRKQAFKKFFIGNNKKTFRNGEQFLKFLCNKEKIKVYLINLLFLRTRSHGKFNKYDFNIYYDKKLIEYKNKIINLIILIILIIIALIIVLPKI
jgi:hypothetical protein